jgi:signal transduction histidine kinase
MATWSSHRRIVSSIAGIVSLLTLFACATAWAAEPKRVVLLLSFGRDFKPWSEYAKAIRLELDRQSPSPLDITEHSLLTARSSDESSDGAFVGYLSALYSKVRPDLIVSLGAPAVAFVQQHREQLFPNTPMVFTAVEQRRVRFAVLTPNDAVVAVAHDFPAAFENILRVLPDTKNVTVVNGDSPLEKFWLEELRRELKPFEPRIALTFTNDLSLQNLLDHAAALPPQSAIFWHLMLVDAAGGVHESGTALTKLYAVAKAPIFSYDDGFFGRELVGGPMHSVIEGSRQTASVAVRILQGEKPGDIKIAASGFAAPKFDWREMVRWGISESRLPPGSEIHFRNPTAWDQYRPQILLIFAAFLLQTALTAALFYEHRRRHLAEVLTRNSIAELNHVNRVATAGELSASIAHEVNQPLTGIVARASAARRWLARETPDIDKARAALDQIEIAGHRASDIIKNVKSMFRKDTTDKSQVDINRLIRTVLELVRIDLRKNRIVLRSQIENQLPVLGNQVQLQQVILNLIMNAIDSMHSVQSRVLSVESKLNGQDSVHVSIEDTGSGIDPSDRDQIFKPLFTTKQHGMGIGLSICHSIIESHNGRIWVTAGSNSGTIFHFELPTKAV